MTLLLLVKSITSFTTCCFGLSVASIYMFNPGLFWKIYNFAIPEKEDLTDNNNQDVEKPAIHSDELNVSFAEQREEEKATNSVANRSEPLKEQDNVNQTISIFLLLQDNKQDTEDLKELVNPRKSFTCKINGNPEVRCYLRETKKWSPSEYLSFIKGFDQKYKIPKFEETAKLFMLDLEQIHQLELKDSDVQCLNIAMNDDEAKTCLSPLFLVHNSKIMWVNKMFEEIRPV